MANKANKSFAGGEFAPALYARTDIQKYETGLRTCRNYIVMRQGGVTKRPGTEFITEQGDSSTKGRLIPFVFSVSDTLVLEFGHLTLRFIQNGGVVEDPANLPNPLEIVSPYSETDLPGLQYVQSGDVVTIVHRLHPVYELRRNSNTSWTFSPVVFGVLDFATISSLTGGDPATTFNTSYIVTGFTEAGEETAGSPPMTIIHPPTADHNVLVEALCSGGCTSWNLYRQDGDTGAFGFIAAGIGPFVEYVDFGTTIPDITLRPPIVPILFASVGNYPSVVAYYQQRLMFANSDNAPDTVWASRTGFFHNFNTSFITQDDDAITFRLVGDEIDPVRHILNLGRLVILTEGAEYIVEGDGNGVLTPASVNPRIGSTNGVASVKPIKADNRLLFIQAMGSAVRDLKSDVQFGYYSLEGNEISIFSSHLLDGFGVTDWAWQQIPMHVVWAVRSDGIMIAVTYIPEQEVLAWHRHDSLGFFESCCVVPEGRAHWLYVIVRRLINGAYHRYVERMTTSNVLPVFATPEEAAAAPGGVTTPPPPPPPPPPAPTPISPPTSPSTTDVSTTSATANWIAGAVVAESRVQIRLQGGSDSSWLSVDIAPGLISYHFTGLASNTMYEWRVAHFIGATLSAYLGPSGPTQFTTTFVSLTLSDPASAPVIDSQAHPIGFTSLFISWPAAPITGEVSRLQIAGPTDLTPTDGEYSDIGVFVTGVGNASWNVTVAGTYWLRVRYEQTDFTNSGYAGPSSWAITVS